MNYYLVKEYLKRVSEESGGKYGEFSQRNSGK